MKPVLLAVLLAGLASSVVAQTSPVVETVFVPAISFVGDLVEARITLLLPEGKSVRPPLSLPTQDWLLIRDVQIRHDPPFERVTVKYISFEPGTKTLPLLVLGDVPLEGVSLTTTSLLGKAASPELAPPRDQMLLPHTELVLFLAFLVVIVLPLVVWRFAPPVIDVVRQAWKRADRHRAWRQLNKDLKRLELKALSLRGPEFYTELQRLVRAYLGTRFDHDFQSLTATEVRVLLHPLPPAWAAEWVRLLHRADVVRFDAQDPPESEKRDDLDSLRRESSRLEGKEGPHVDL